MVKAPKRAFRLNAPVAIFTSEDVELKDFINEQIIDPLFRDKGVILTEYGNCSGIGSLEEEIKAAKEKIEWRSNHVRKACIVIEEALIQPAQKRGGPKLRGSYGLKHDVEKLVGEYISNGECIVAAILMGCAADFGETHEYGPFVNPRLYP